MRCTTVQLVLIGALAHGSIASAGTLCFDPLVLRATFETVVCPVGAEPLETLEALLLPPEPIPICVPPGSEAGINYCQGPCSLGGNGCDGEISTSNLQINVSDDLICLDTLVSVPSVDVDAGVLGSCTMSFDLLGSSESMLTATYTAPLMWAYSASLSTFVVDDVVTSGCDSLGALLPFLIAAATAQAEETGGEAVDALLGALANTKFCPVESLHPDYVGQ